MCEVRTEITSRFLECGHQDKVYRTSRNIKK
ncbi:hypothetical protein BN2127_JRS10_04446 [Bacillus subtilis]|nr:hypothetical protein BN2127_JRS10_04446 [Bacillus subtilis]